VSLAARLIQAASFLALLLALRCGPAYGATPPPDAANSIVAIGDVHGDFDDFCAILQRAGLIDGQRHWIGGKTTLIQLGDLIDRGPKPREVMDLVMSLEEQAAKDGGQVMPLLGNHEVMNLMGDLRYVTPENFASFADTDSEKRQGAALQEYLAWRKSHPQLLAELFQPVLPETEAEWIKRHPLGFIEQRQSFSPEGRYGKWVRSRSALAKIGGDIFLHGGISPTLVTMKLDAINAGVRNEIHEFDDLRKYLVDERVLLQSFTLQEANAVALAELTAERKSRAQANASREAKIEQFLKWSTWLCVQEDGPLWFRGYDRWSEDEGGPQIEKILRAFGASNLIVGHTVQKTANIRSRFGGKILLIDTGMLSSYYPGGKPSALKMSEDGKFTAVYLDHEVVLLEGKAAPSEPKKDQ
jgi:hypothetical protein